MKKKEIILISSLFLGFLLESCQIGYGEASTDNSISLLGKVTITFEQYEDCDGVYSGKTGFGGDLLSVSKLQYDYGYYLTREDIESFEENINYVMPELNGDGYGIFTAFSFSKEEPMLHIIGEMTLFSDFTLYYGIWG